LIRLGHSPDPGDAFMFWALLLRRGEAAGAFAAPVQVDFVGS
jgi:predicted solute-binding protein